MEEKDQRQENQTKFCRLCAKHKPEKEFMDTPLAKLQDGRTMIVVKCCQSCRVVISNIRIIVMEGEKKLAEQIKAALPEESRIIVPGLVVPKNLKNLKIVQ